MTVVTSYTSARMAEIEGQAIVGGAVVGDDLILTRFNAATLNAGNVRGPVGSPGVTQAEMNATLAEFTANQTPIGTVVDYMGTAAPAKWMLMTGNTVVNGQTLYPALWAILPASMKVGADILFPDTRGKFAVGYNAADALFNAIGDVGGSKDTVVVTHTHGQPTHTHTGPDHQHTGPSHSHPFGGLTITGAGLHSHDIGHNHPAFDTAYVDAVAGSPRFYQWYDGGSYNVNLSAGTYTPQLTMVTGNHRHSIDVPALTGVQSDNEPNHTHPISGSTAPDGTGLTGLGGTQVTSPSGNDLTLPTGVAATDTNLPPFVTFQKIIKVE